MPERATVVILGASSKPERFSHKAFTLLRDAGYRIIPVHPVLDNIEGVPVVHDLEQVQAPVHTLTLYLSPENSKRVIAQILALHPHRVILNPGTESQELREALLAQGIEVVEDCTIMMLNSGRF